ncbi:MAG TPA: GxxExxY protein [Gemmatimonadaceae bacterium]
MTHVKRVRTNFVRMANHERPLLHAATTQGILDAFREVHRTFGFGYREFIYSLAMERELIARGHRVRREVPIMIYFRGEPLATQKVDMLVDEVVIVENKATEQLHPSANPILFSYLCSSDLEVGMLLHFGHEAAFQRILCENRFKRRPK